MQNNSVVGVGGIGFSGTDVEYDYYSLTNNTNYKYSPYIDDSCGASPIYPFALNKFSKLGNICISIICDIL